SGAPPRRRLRPARLHPPPRWRRAPTLRAQAPVAPTVVFGMRSGGEAAATAVSRGASGGGRAAPHRCALALLAADAFPGLEVAPDQIDGAHDLDRPGAQVDDAHLRRALHDT